MLSPFVSSRDRERVVSICFVDIDRSSQVKNEPTLASSSSLSNSGAKSTDYRMVRANSWFFALTMRGLVFVLFCSCVLYAFARSARRDCFISKAKIRYEQASPATRTRLPVVVQTFGIENEQIMVTKTVVSAHSLNDGDVFVLAVVGTNIVYVYVFDDNKNAHTFVCFSIHLSFDWFSSYLWNGTYARQSERAKVRI